MVKTKKDLRVCSQNKHPCIKLIGVAPKEPSCGLGLKCGRKECTEYEPDYEIWKQEILVFSPFLKGLIF